MIKLCKCCVQVMGDNVLIVAANTEDKSVCPKAKIGVGKGVVIESIRVKHVVGGKECLTVTMLCLLGF